MRPWESLSRQAGGRSLAAAAGARGQGQARLAPAGFVCANASWKKPAILRVLGSFGIRGRWVRSDFPDGPAANPRPRLNVRWEFYPISGDVTTAMCTVPTTARVIHSEKRLHSDAPDDGPVLSRLPGPWRYKAERL